MTNTNLSIVGGKLGDQEIGAQVITYLVIEKQCKFNYLHLYFD